MRAAIIAAKYFQPCIEHFYPGHLKASGVHKVRLDLAELSWQSVGLIIGRWRVRYPTGVAAEISSPNFTFYAEPCSVSISPPPILPGWHVKDPSHSAKSAGGRLHLNMEATLTQRSEIGLTVLSRHSVEIYQGNELTRNWSWDTRPKSSAMDRSWPKDWNWCARDDIH